MSDEPEVGRRIILQDGPRMVEAALGVDGAVRTEVLELGGDDDHLITIPASGVALLLAALDAAADADVLAVLAEHASTVFAWDARAWLHDHGISIGVDELGL